MDSLYSLIPNRKAWPVPPPWQRLRVLLEAGKPAELCGVLATFEVDRCAEAGAESPALLLIAEGRAVRCALRPVLLAHHVMLVPRALRIEGGSIVGVLFELQSGIELPARSAA